MGAQVGAVFRYGGSSRGLTGATLSSKEVRQHSSKIKKRSSYAISDVYIYEKSSLKLYVKKKYCNDTFST